MCQECSIKGLRCQHFWNSLKSSTIRTACLDICKMAFIDQRRLSRRINNVIDYIFKDLKEALTSSSWLINSLYCEILVLKGMLNAVVEDGLADRELAELALKCVDAMGELILNSVRRSFRIDCTLIWFIACMLAGFIGYLMLLPFRWVGWKSVSSTIFQSLLCLINKL